MITSSTVRLRGIEREDIPTFVQWMNDPEVIKYLLINSPLSKVMEEKWFDHQLEIPPEQGQVLAIEVLDSRKWVMIGTTGLHNIEQVNRAAEFGISIGDKRYWNKGYGVITSKLMLKHGFEDLNLNRIYLNVFAENTRAIKAYEAAGYIREGILRQALYKNGSYHDCILMSVLHSEWKGFEG
jgi:RimJ/RimL family protein N-acetyltransferase